MNAERESLQAALERLFQDAADPTAGHWAELARSLRDVLPDTARVLSRVDGDAARVVQGLVRHAAMATGALRDADTGRSRDTDTDIGRRDRSGDAERADVSGDIAPIIEAAGAYETADEIVHHIPALSCELGFDRAMFSRVEGGVWVTQKVYVTGDSDWAEHIRSAGSRPQLVEKLVENQVLQERKAIIMQGVQDADRVHKPIADASLCRSYVAAPVVVNGGVVGLIHADHYFDPRDPQAHELGRLTTLSSGFTLAIERAQAIEKVRAAERLLSGVVDGLRTTTLDLATPATQARRAAVAGRRIDGLTRREEEVLELMADGGSNAAIGERLVITEETVKRHVKSVLRKLGARNRVEAVAWWYRTGC